MKPATLLIPVFLALAIVAPPLFAAGDQPPTLALGSKAPDFKLPGVDGKTYTLKEFDRSPVLVIVFTCNHCPTAQAYEDRIIKLHADYKDKGVAIVAINPNDPQAVRLDELGYTDLGDSFEDMRRTARGRGPSHSLDAQTGHSSRRLMGRRFRALT